uniref:C2H2-type domain-containing protein n=1 Tax=Heterorhabditis bacteriophora TaxID=37862 RepID=A0A1I7WTD4_HETBA
MSTDAEGRLYTEIVRMKRELNTLNDVNIMKLFMECELCNATYPKACENLYLRHLKVFHGVMRGKIQADMKRRKPFSCIICSESSKSVDSLNTYAVTIILSCYGYS